jgi:VWFA-related protein
LFDGSENSAFDITNRNNAQPQRTYLREHGIETRRMTSSGGCEMLRFPLALILLAATTVNPAQRLDNSNYGLTVDVELVQLPVSVVDKQGVPIRGLRREQFTVYEDKVEQQISLFKQEDIPLSVALVIDASGSMSNKVDRLSAAAMTFVKESNPEDETAIVSFGDDVELEQDFTSNTQKLSQALATISPKGATSLYDAILLAANHLRKQGFHEKKVLLIVSDGDDNHSRYSLNRVLDSLRESPIIVYSVGLRDPSDDSPVFGSLGRKALGKVAEVTGGISYFPRSVSDVQQICRTIARDLRNQYTVGYRPSNDKLDGSWRKVLVRINPAKGVPSVKIRTKQGYYAPVARTTQELSERLAAAYGWIARASAVDIRRRYRPSSAVDDPPDALPVPCAAPPVLAVSSLKLPCSL